MTSTAQESSAARLREFEALTDEAARVVAVMAAIVRAREERGWQGERPPEVLFAECAAEGVPPLPAAVWVALRRDDVSTVLDALTEGSELTFVISRREEMGEGYRLQTVEETETLPDVERLLAQLALVLDIPADVLGVLGRWGLDDSRTAGEVNALLDSRFGAAGQPVAPATGLVMSVLEATDVLQLTPAQAKALETLVRRTGVTITA